MRVERWKEGGSASFRPALSAEGTSGHIALEPARARGADGARRAGGARGTGGTGRAAGRARSKRRIVRRPGRPSVHDRDATRDDLDRVRSGKRHCRHPVRRVGGSASDRPESRGDGSVHKAVRKRYAALVDAGEAVCARCGKPIPAGRPSTLTTTPSARATWASVTESATGSLAPRSRTLATTDIRVSGDRLVVRGARSRKAARATTSEPSVARTRSVLETQPG
jgi:hypothetical protein